jgi:glutamate synthase domain-containing protein 3
VVVALVNATDLDCAKLTTREFNIELRRLLAEGAEVVDVLNPAARHNLAVALETVREPAGGREGTGVTIRFAGPVGWYAAGMNDGPRVEVRGNCGWGVAECMMRGSVTVSGHAGSGAAASIRGGTVFVAGDAGARAGIAMKGGTLVVGGDVGYMSGFMMQRGTMVVCGNAADGLGDSMYEGVIYIAGSVAGYGADAVERELDDDDLLAVAAALGDAGVDLAPDRFRKVVAGRRLWNFAAKDAELWRAHL